MLIRYGLAHAMVLLAGLAGCGFCFWAVRTINLSPRTLWTRRLRLNVFLVALGLAILLLGPVLLFDMGTTIWVLRDGPNGSLDQARFKLYGQTGKVPRPGAPPVQIGPGATWGDLVVNLSDGRLVIETVQYGGQVLWGSPPQVLLEPGQYHCVEHAKVDAVSDPPDRLQVSKKAGIATQTFVHREH